MGNGFVLNTATKILAFSAGFVQLNKYKPRRAQSTQRVKGKIVNMKTVTESFAISARSAVNKIKPQRTLRAQRV